MQTRDAVFVCENDSAQPLPPPLSGDEALRRCATLLPTCTELVIDGDGRLQMAMDYPGDLPWFGQRERGMSVGCWHLRPGGLDLRGKRVRHDLTTKPCFSRNGCRFPLECMWD